MIGTVDVTVQAAKPDFPISPFCAYASSPSSVRVRNVPRRIGTWDITSVSVSVDYPDGTTATAACVLTAGVWVGTVPGCETPGDALRGFVVRADGVDENGGPVTGYVLGVGDVEILNRETALTPGVVTFKGDPGPQGPQGERGPEGPQGPKGDPGSGAVESVNGKVGAVELNGDDIEVGGGGDTRAISGAIHENETKINSHIAARDNPHGVTVEQIGAQKKLTAGENVTITADGVISASGGGSAVVESEDNPGFAANADFANSSSSAGSVPWSGVNGKPTSFSPSAHASSHATGGGDPITAEDIGALPITGGSLHDDRGFVELNVGVSGRSSGVIRAESNGFFPGRIEAEGEGASITKGGREVATEEQVGAAKDELNARIDLIEATTKPNMNIVGSPKFNHGVVSGFSANDYLMFPTQVNVGQNTVEFYMSFTTGADVATQQNLLDSWCGLAVAIKNGRFILAASSDGTSFVQNQSDAVVNHNTSYNVSVRFVNPAQGVYLVKLSDEDAMDDLATVELSAPLFPTATYWGGANPQSGVNHIFSGAINLNECRMVWNGAEVWRGYDELPTVKFDPTATPRLDTAEKIASQSAYPMVAVVGGALEDRTINHATAGGSFTFPVRTGTNARDFVLVIDSLATAPSVTFPAGVTYVSEQDAADVWTAEANKVNAWYFSEQTDGVFMVCHKAMSVVAQ